MILTFGQFTLKKSCILLCKHRQKSNLSSVIRLVILIYLLTVKSVRLRDDEVFANSITDIEVQVQKPDAIVYLLRFYPLCCRNL